MPDTDRSLLSAARCRLAILAGRLAAAFYRRAGWPGASRIAGVVAVRLCPDFLRVASSSLSITLVSGTNGKTTTTRLTAKALGTDGQVITNELGANMPTGIAAALVGRRRRTRFGVVEVDERYLPAVARETRPATVVLLNLSRDQLDRTPECRTIADLWRAALADTSATVVANADDPLVAWAASAARTVVWTAVGQRWTDDSWYCPSCTSLLDRPDDENWFCGGGCGFSRPDPEWTLRGDFAEHLTGQTRYRIKTGLPGRANRANAVMALVAAQVARVHPDTGLARMRDVQAVAGRYERFHYAGNDVRLLLAKNPASWLETLDLLDQAGPVVLAFNARDLDGTDTSWLWDVDFGALRDRQVFVMGERRFDMAVRLHYNRVPFTQIDSLADTGSAGGRQRLDVVANYTAFLSMMTMIHEGRACQPAC